MIKTFYPLHDYVLIKVLGDNYGFIEEIGDELRYDSEKNQYPLLNEGDIVYVGPGAQVIRIQYIDGESHVLVRFKDIVGIMTLEKEVDND